MMKNTKCLLVVFFLFLILVAVHLSEWCWSRSVGFGDVNARQTHAHGLEHRSDISRQHDGDDLANGSSEDVQVSQHRDVAPDHFDSQAAECAAPATSDEASAEKSKQFVDDVSGVLEAAGGVFPDAVHGVGSFRLGEHIVELDLNELVHAIWVTVFHI